MALSTGGAAMFSKSTALLSWEFLVLSLGSRSQGFVSRGNVEGRAVGALFLLPVPTYASHAQCIPDEDRL